MKHRCVLVPIALAAACGGNEPLFDGYQPAAGTAVEFTPGVCDIPFVGSTAASGWALWFSDFAQPCDVVMQTNLCGNKANATSVVALAFAGEVDGTTPPTAGPGTYRFFRDPPTGSFLAAGAAAARVDGACMGESLAQNGGTITIDTATSTNVAGSLDLDFENGTNLSYAFDVAVCPVTIDICDRLAAGGCVGQFTCVP
jgi:hypothetical protein